MVSCNNFVTVSASLISQLLCAMMTFYSVPYNICRLSYCIDNTLGPLIAISTDFDDCVNQRCDNGGSCVDGVNNYSCSCVAGYTGDYCERGNDLFKEKPFKILQLSLIIKFNLSLPNMSLDIDDCVNHACINSGSCVDGINSYSCNCHTGYTGVHCQTGKL